MPSNHLILCCPLLLPSIFPSIRVFSNESVLCISWPKYQRFTFNISPSSEFSGLISFRMDWLDLLAVQGTLRSLLQHHSSKASILLCSAFFIVQVSHPYMTTGKTIALTRQTFVSKRVRYDWVTFTFNICKMVFMALKVKVAQPCLTLFDPMDSTIHGIFQARTLEWVAISFSRRFSQQRDRTQVSHNTGGFFTSWASREAYL